MLNPKDMVAQIERDERDQPRPKPYLQSLPQSQPEPDPEQVERERSRIRRAQRERNYFQYWIASETVLRGLGPKAIGSAKVERAFKDDSRVIQITTPESAGPQRRVTVEFESSGIVSCRAGWLNGPEGQQSHASYCTGFPLEQDTSYFPPQVAKRSNEILEFVKRELKRTPVLKT